MCSNAEQPGSVPGGADVATLLAIAIDELAAAASIDQDATSPDVAARLARAWALIAAADPELAARTARYSPS
jgi:hypothetical protein